jgi:signal transduction histidine kinase
LSTNLADIDDASIIIATCPYGILTINDEGLVSFANPAFCNIVNINYAEILNIPSHALWKVLLESYTIDGDLKTYIGGILTLRAKNSLKVIRLNSHLHKSGILRQIFYVQDITAESEVDRMKTEFLSAAAHELRTPLAIIFGFTELLISNEFDKSATLDIVRTVHNQAKSLTHIINELLDLVRIESRKGKDFVMVEQPITDIILEVKKEWDGLANAERISIKAPKNTPLLCMDKDKIKQAIINVLSNACKFSSPNSPIKIEIVHLIKDDEKFIGVQISDQGLGMTPAQQDHLFERFWRANTTSNIPGSGLGLAIVKEIIEIHHGYIDVESKSQQGTTITLWLPSPHEGSLPSEETIRY